MAGKPFKRTILTTAGVTSIASSVIEVMGNVEEIHLISNGLANGDKDLAVQIDNSPDTTPTPAYVDYYVDGVQQVISATTGSIQTGVVLRAPGSYRVNKTTSAGAVTVQALYHFKNHESIA